MNETTTTTMMMTTERTVRAPSGTMQRVRTSRTMKETAEWIESDDLTEDSAETLRRVERAALDFLRTLRFEVVCPDQSSVFDGRIIRCCGRKGMRTYVSFRCRHFLSSSRL